MKKIIISFFLTFNFILSQITINTEAVDFEAVKIPGSSFTYSIEVENTGDEPLNIEVTPQFEQITQTPWLQQNYADVSFSNLVSTEYINDINIRDRDNVLKLLNNDGIQSRPVWNLLHKLNFFLKCPKSELKVSEDLFSKMISLPSGPNLLRKEI
mgnify:CR=1 FL=1